MECNPWISYLKKHLSKLMIEEHKKFGPAIQELSKKWRIDKLPRNQTRLDDWMKTDK